MKKIVASLVLSLGVSGVAFAEGDVAAGQQKAAVCTACHGPKGVSIAPNFPNLAGQGERYLIKQIKDIKSGERKVLEMTGMTDNLSDQDIKDIAAFYAAQTPPPVGSVAADKVALGEEIFRGGIRAKGVPACASCHTPTGNGLELAGFPKLSGQSAEYIAKQLRDFRDERRVNDGDTMVMRTIAQGMLDKDIDAVSSYINGLY